MTGPKVITWRVVDIPESVPLSVRNPFDALGVESRSLPMPDVYKQPGRYVRLVRELRAGQADKNGATAAVAALNRRAAAIARLSGSAINLEARLSEQHPVGHACLCRSNWRRDTACLVGPLRDCERLARQPAQGIPVE